MTFAFILGRFQPLHDGHIKLMRTVLNEGKNVVVGLRNTEKDKNNPYSIAERREMFRKAFPNEIGKTLRIRVVPDITEIFYGRAPGYKIREIRLNEETESVSGTAIRNKISEDKK